MIDNFSPEMEFDILEGLEMPKIIRWTLEEGIEFVRKLENDLRNVGFHCALTGSVLYKGVSYKDLDVMIYPHDTTNCDWSMVEVILKQGHSIEINLIDRLKYPDQKKVFWSENNDKRIDFFFVQ
jgi:hypothetical protein